jgi:pilus assembly protein Flp/PilA
MLQYMRILLAGQKAKMDERGASAVEYGLLIAGIAALIVTVVFLFGDNLQAVFDDTCAQVTGNAAPDPGTADCTAP